MKDFINRLLKRIIWVPLCLGVIGYYIVEGLPFWKALYASGALYFVNPVSDAENVWIILAKISAMIVATGVILSFLSSIYRVLERLIALSFSDSTAVYTDQEAGDRLVKRMRHGFYGRTERGNKAEKAKHQIVFFRDDEKNLEFFENRDKSFGDSQIYLLVTEADPFLLAAMNRSGVRFINLYEVMARKYWKEHNLYNVRQTKEFSVSIVGYGLVGRAIFRYGYLNNLYSLDQKITYHIWGCNPSDTAFLETLPTENDDRIVLHEGEWQEDLDTIASSDRVILTEEEDAMKLAQEVLYRNAGAEIHYYNATGQHWGDFLDSKNLVCFGNLEEYLTEEDIKSERLYRIGKLFNYDYFLRYGEKPKDHFDEKEMEEEWVNLNGFKKSSSIARGDHFWIEKKLREEGAYTEEEFWRLEHYRWSRFHYINHWTYAEKRDNEHRKHNLLVPFDELSLAEKEKDGFYSPHVQAEIEKLVDEGL